VENQRAGDAHLAREVGHVADAVRKGIEQVRVDTSRQSLVGHLVLVLVLRHAVRPVRDRRTSGEHDAGSLVKVFSNSLEQVEVGLRQTVHYFSDGI
jgi:hypothetical protein